MFIFRKYLQVMQEYFKELEEESIRDNFVICYELLDELVDFGYPQTTDAKILQEYITQVSEWLDSSVLDPDPEICPYLDPDPNLFIQEHSQFWKRVKN